MRKEDEGIKNLKDLMTGSVLLLLGSSYPLPKDLSKPQTQQTAAETQSTAKASDFCTFTLQVSFLCLYLISHQKDLREGVGDESQNVRKLSQIIQKKTA